MKTMDDILMMIQEEDVEFIRLQFADVYGNMKNIAVTPGQLKRVVENQYGIVGSVMFDNQIDYDKELYLHPDLDTFVILPWRPQHGKVGKIICDICYADGTMFEYSPRKILGDVVKKAKEDGYTFTVTPECEFFLFDTDDNGNPTTVSHETAGYLDVGPADFGENARRDMALMLEEMGFEIESSHHEKAPAQHEIDFTQGEALETADALMTFKFAIRSIAKRFGLYATFMPKPKADVAGSGMHLNISMYKDGINLFDPKEGEELSPVARAFAGGVLAHAEGMCAITNPIVNSYKRILSGYGAPSDISWTAKNIKSTVRMRKIFGESKVEIRLPDPSANPYLAIAVCIAAGMDGIRKGIDPDQIHGRTKRHLPGNLKDALRSFRKDEYLKEVLGKEFCETYVSLKTKEWNEYMMQVSDWEIAKYLGKM